MHIQGNKTPYPVQWFFGLLSGLIKPFVKTRKRLVILTAFHGDGYRGNTKVLFESLLEHPELQAVWLTRSHDVYNMLHERYGDSHVAYIHSWRGIKLLAAAGAIMLTHGTSDYAFTWLSRKALIIQTYHGLPTKRGEYMRPDSDDPPGWIHRLILGYRFGSVDYFLSTSPDVSQIFAQRFNLDSRQFLECGFPSLDALFATKIDTDYIRIHFPEAPEGIKHVILYAPTFRRLHKTRWFPFSDADLVRFARFLEKHDAIMVLRAHPNEHLRLDEYRRISNRFLDGGQAAIEDVNELIVLSDVIVTDYSGIALEGFLLDKPAVFLPYDIDRYERGLPFPYETMAAGPQPETQTAFELAIEDAFDGAPVHANARERARTFFFRNQGHDATRKVIAFLESKLTDTGVD